MTIRKGQDWGTMQPAGPSTVIVGTDAELRSYVIAHRGSAVLPSIGLTGGDLLRTLGGSGDRRRFDGSEAIPHLPIDLVHVVADEQRETVFLAHLIARGSRWRGTWWRGQVTAAMNAQFLGAWNVAPRGHPNDGRLDVVIVSSDLGPRQRWQARSRVRLGTHVPHPLITARQAVSTVIELAGQTPLVVDGQRWGSARHLSLTVEPDALTVCI
ncbi:MAG: hypothetical protein ABIW84_04925 [Ilumatobacteraceae bacterium]